jgi:hypothetical protein
VRVAPMSADGRFRCKSRLLRIELLAALIISSIGAWIFGRGQLASASLEGARRDITCSSESSLAGQRIERTERLIEQQQLWIGQNGTAKGGPLFPAAGGAHQKG